LITDGVTDKHITGPNPTCVYTDIHKKSSQQMRLGSAPGRAREGDG